MHLSIDVAYTSARRFRYEAIERPVGDGLGKASPGACSVCNGGTPQRSGLLNCGIGVGNCSTPQPHAKPKAGRDP